MNYGDEKINDEFMTNITHIYDKYSLYLNKILAGL